MRRGAATFPVKRGEPMEQKVYHPAVSESDGKTLASIIGAAVGDILSADCVLIEDTMEVNVRIFTIKTWGVG